jgi:hypothetical protein
MVAVRLGKIVRREEIMARMKKTPLPEQVMHTMDTWIDEHRWATVALAGVAIGAVALVAVAAPGALRGPFQILRKRSVRQEVFRARTRLLRKGYIRREKLFGMDARYVLTKKGEKKFALFLLALPKKKQKRWDRLWRVLLYDIPEKHRASRNRMRQLIRQFGCYQLQKNVWVYPYHDMQELLDYLHLLYGKGRSEIMMLEAKRFPDDEKLKKFFHL